jgi:hypothetical protein
VLQPFVRIIHWLRGRLFSGPIDGKTEIFNLDEYWWYNVTVLAYTEDGELQYSKSGNEFSVRTKEWSKFSMNVFQLQALNHNDHF